MKISSLSKEFRVCQLSPNNAETVLDLCMGNPIFYSFHPPLPTMESILEDMQALPPGKTYADKFYIGFWKDSTLVAVMDLILDYPRESIAFIGFFMMNLRFQGTGIGSSIIQDCLVYLSSIGFTSIQLGIDKGNPQSEHFWAKNGFKATGREFSDVSVSYVYMERSLSKA